MIHFFPETSLLTLKVSVSSSWIFNPAIVCKKFRKWEQIFLCLRNNIVWYDAGVSHMIKFSKNLWPLRADIRGECCIEMALISFLDKSPMNTYSRFYHLVCLLMETTHALSYHQMSCFLSCKCLGAHSEFFPLSKMYLGREVTMAKCVEHIYWTL